MSDQFIEVVTEFGIDPEQVPADVLDRLRAAWDRLEGRQDTPGPPETMDDWMRSRKAVDGPERTGEAFPGQLTGRQPAPASIPLDVPDSDAIRPDPATMNDRMRRSH